MRVCSVCVCACVCVCVLECALCVYVVRWVCVLFELVRVRVRGVCAGVARVARVLQMSR